MLPGITTYDRSRGFTLIEVLMTVVIIGILATVALRSVQSGIESSRIRATQEEMDGLAWAIAGNPDLYANGLRSDFGYIGDVGALPSSLDNLVTNPGGYSTWDGPYISRRFTQDSDGFKEDAWGNAYTFTGGITIASTGGGSTPMTKSVAAAATDLTTNSISGTVNDAGGNPPGDSSVAITVTVTYPDGAGGTTTSSTNPASGGAFSIPSIPVGIRSVEAVYRATNDTVTAYACVLPKLGAILGFRLPNAPFAVSSSSGGGSLEYVASSAQTTGANNDNVQFDITNTGSSSVATDWLSAVYSPTAYFQEIWWGGSAVFSESTPRAGSGDTCIFTSIQVLAASSSVTIQLITFKDDPTGGFPVDMRNTDFTITFSDGSVISFNSGS
ncbi:MAG TPA: prepilin-type N-terminal cleavage/methylation domain-containing protein [Acidobacteriota bacterium]|nr:prepilin-type N-terminal cleavage/methylation domain-containing protein [Acidobacteriota bacterium]